MILGILETQPIMTETRPIMAETRPILAFSENNEEFQPIFEHIIETIFHQIFFV